MHCDKLDATYISELSRQLKIMVNERRKQKPSNFCQYLLTTGHILKAYDIEKYRGNERYC